MFSGVSLETMSSKALVFSSDIAHYRPQMWMRQLRIQVQWLMMYSPCGRTDTSTLGSIAVGHGAWPHWSYAASAQPVIVIAEEKRLCDR